MEMKQPLNMIKIKKLILSLFLCAVLIGICICTYRASHSEDFMAQPHWRIIESVPYVSYGFFSNAGQWYYNLNLETDAAQVICDYAPDDSEEGTWRLCRMDARLEQEKPVVSNIYVRSETGRELYLLAEKEGWEQRYLVMADISSKASESGVYDYDTDLFWESYQEESDSSDQYFVCVDEDAYIYDKDMIEEGVKAAKAYMAKLSETQRTWKLLEHMTYIGANGYLANFWFYDGAKRVHMVVDLLNHRYTVVKTYDEPDELDYENWHTGLVSDIESSEYWRKSDHEEVSEDFFKNAELIHYNIGAERAVAGALQTYLGDEGVPGSKWELTHLYSENGILHAFVGSGTYRGLYMLLREKPDGEEEWLVIADIQQGNDRERQISGGGSYDTVLKWDSYEAWAMDEKDSDYFVSGIRTYQYNQYDSIYAFQATCAMQAYLTGIEADKTEKWEIVYDRMFAEHGCFLDAWYTNGNRQVHLFIDIWNKLYLVMAQ